MAKVIQLNVKAKKEKEVGLPKHQITEAFVTKSGMQGDFNNYRYDKMNNTEEQALLIMPIEMINKLNQEGWPLKAGDIGENLTTEGIPYNDFQPNSSFKAGDVEFEITYACDPCNNLEHLPYVGKEKGTEFIKTMVKRRGWYAKVIKEGKIKTGDTLQKL